VILQRDPKKCTHSFIVNIFETKWHVVTILARYCSVKFAHVSGDERFYLQQDGAPPHYHRHVRAYLDDTLPGRWIGRRGAIEYPPRSPGLTPLDFYLWGTLKDEVYRQKPATLNALQETIEASCAAITPDTLTAADGGHFKHI
jgi:hypothetical protein